MYAVFVSLVQNLFYCVTYVHCSTNFTFHIFANLAIVTILVEFNSLHKDENVNRYVRDQERERERERERGY